VRLRDYRAATITNDGLPGLFAQNLNLTELTVFSICHTHVQFQFMNLNLVEAWGDSYQVL
jgi:hypothetical protein